MAKQIIGKNGHLCIEMTMNEALNKCGFGIPYDGVIVCDNCNIGYDSKQEQPVYYIAVLHMLFCKDCFDDYVTNAPYYKEDRGIEIDYYNRYAKILNLELL